MSIITSNTITPRQEIEYIFFLNGCDPHENALVNQALQDWAHTSKLSPKTLERAGIKIFSGTDAILKDRLGYASIGGHSILKTSTLVEIPYHDSKGKVLRFEFRLYPALEGKKYLQALNKPAYPYILPEVYEVSDKVHKPLWITEGAKKVLKLIQHGRLTVGLSGVWNFKAGQTSDEPESTELWKDLEKFKLNGRAVYIGFDADLWTNPMVRLALFTLAFTLTARGAVVKIPSWKSEKGIDDYLSQSAEPERELLDIESKAKSIEKFIEFEHRNETIRALSKTHMQMDSLTREGLIKGLAKKLHITPKRFYAELKEFEKPKIVEIPQDIKDKAEALLKNPNLKDLFLEHCHKRYLGRDKELILIKLATMTRHSKRGLSVIITGSSSVGKSELINAVLDTCEQSAIENFSRTSAQYLLYKEGDLSNKIIVIYEYNGAKQSVEMVRTAITEGVLRLGTVLKDSAGNLQSKEIEKKTDGLVVLSTFTGTYLDTELSTRVLQMEISHDERLQRSIYFLKSEGSAGGADNDLWRVADGLIENKPVKIPYLKAIAGLFPTDNERYMRDFDKVTMLITASALWHQHQRKQADDIIIADRQDYELIYELSSAFTQSVTPVSEPALKMLSEAYGKECTRNELQAILGVSEPTIKRYIRKCKGAGFIDVEGRGGTQRIKVLEIPERVTILPKPEEVFENVSLHYDDRLTDFELSVDGSHYEPVQPPLTDSDPLTDNGLNRSNRSQPVKHQRTVESFDGQGSTQIGQPFTEKNNNFFEKYAVSGDGFILEDDEGNLMPKSPLPSYPVQEVIC